MSMYAVAFTLSSKIVVDCDDEADARRFVENVGSAQLLQWIHCRGESEAKVTVLSAVPVAPGAQPRKRSAKRQQHGSDRRMSLARAKTT